MKRIILLTALMCMPITAVLAQTRQDFSKTTLVKGAWAMQFRVAPNFTLTSFEGFAFSGKWHVRDKRAIRFGIDVRGSFENSETSTVSRVINTSDPTRESENNLLEDREVNSFTISFGGYYLAYPQHGKTVNVYTGIGPIINWRTSTQDQLSTNSTSATERVQFVESSGEGSAVNAGLRFILGAEWFLNQSMSLTAEYGFSGTFTVTDDGSDATISFSDSEETRVNDTNSRQENLNFGGIGVRFGLSVYF